MALSEQLCRQIVEHIPDGVIVADRDGVIRFWNGGAEAIFGYRPDEALGRTLDLIIPERLRARHWEGYQRVMAGGQTRYGRELLAVPAVRKDGSRISLEFSIGLLREPDGSLSGTLAILRDVTARWERDKALRERLAALESAAQRAAGAD
jgi:PAS domain S-box-containing protein